MARDRYRYRYRTSVLTGPWRTTRDDALRDALGAHQARPDDSAPGGVRWLVPGEIEEEADGRAVPAHAGRQ